MQRIFTTLKALLLFFLASCSCSSDHRNGSYTIGVDIAWYGADLMGQQNNVTGFAQDLLKEIGKKQKMKLSSIQVTWDALLTDLKGGRYQAALSPLYPYIFNQSTFDFSNPFLLTGPVLVLPINSPVTSLEHLNGKEIAYLAGSNGDLILEKNPQILIRPYDTVPDALNAVADGMIDGAIVDVILAASYCQNLYPKQLKIATPPLTDQGLRLIAPVQKADPLIHAFNHGLEELKKSGTYDTLLKKWSLGQGVQK